MSHSAKCLGIKGDLDPGDQGRPGGQRPGGRDAHRKQGLWGAGCEKGSEAEGMCGAGPQGRTQRGVFGKKDKPGWARGRGRMGADGGRGQQHLKMRGSLRGVLSREMT